MTTTRPIVRGVLVLAAAALAGAALLSCRASRVPAAADEFAGLTQFVQNGSFETMDNGSPKAWSSREWQKGGAEFAVDTVAHTGAQSLLIASTTGADASWVTIAPVRPWARYRLSGWIKTQDLEPGTGRGAMINVNGSADWRTRPLSGTNDWTEVAVEFDAGAVDALEITCLLGGWGQSKGKAWFDDVALTQLSKEALGAPAVRVDAAKTGPPMAKAVYGQFIEHLGRCIYQGIWAEMLEDRKFFWPVAEDESPWTIVGDPGRMTMDEKRPFTGAHSPRFALPGGSASGVAQGGLAVVKGKTYVGRVVVAGAPTAAPVKVSLAWNHESQTVEVPKLDGEYVTVPLSFTPAASSDDARLEIVSEGRGWLEVGTASLMPADNVEGFRPDVLVKLKELDAPVYRWPGGNFVSGYDWKDGIGDRDRRPPRKNPAWRGVEHNDVGLHEYLDLMRLLGAQPYVTVNSGLGDVTMAVQEVEYVNGPASTPMGALRAKNGRAEPWDVRLWSVGNEMYGDWQLGHMPLAEYVRKHIAFAEAMRAKDPSIKIVAVGAVGEWDETMLSQAAAHMDYLSEHFYVGEKPGLLAHVHQVPAAVRRIAEAHRGYRKTIPALQAKPVPVALDEWNYWYGPELYGEIGTRYFLKDALGVAAGLHEFARQSDVYAMANYAQTVNVIGAIKTTKTAAEFDTTGLVLKLYRGKFGTVPLAIAGDARPLDVMATKRDGDGAITLSVVNPTRSARTLKVAFDNARRPKTARLWLIAGDDPQDFNEPGKPRKVDIREIAGAPFGKAVTVPPLSISLYEIPGGK